MGAFEDDICKWANDPFSSAHVDATADSPTATTAGVSQHSPLQCACECCDHGEGSDCACDCHAIGLCSSFSLADVLNEMRAYAKAPHINGAWCRDAIRKWIPFVEAAIAKAEGR